MITDCILGRNSTLLGNPLIMYCDKTTKQNHRIISRVFNIIQQELPKKSLVYLNQEITSFARRPVFQSSS